MTKITMQIKVKAAISKTMTIDTVDKKCLAE